MANDSPEPPHPVIAWREALLADGELHPRHDLAATARLVGLGLSMHARRSMKAWPSSSSLAVRCGLGDRAVRRGLADLEAAGWVAAVERGGVLGGRRTTVWRLTTPVAKTEVTPARKTEVEADDPGTSDPTPVPKATTPVAKTDELEEELDAELERETPAAIAFALVQRSPEEAALAVEAAIVKWGSARVTGLVRAYAVAGTRFLFASHLTERINRDASQRIVAVAGPRCHECDGTKMVLPLGASTVEPCPSCSPKSAGLVHSGDGLREGAS